MATQTAVPAQRRRGRAVTPPAAPAPQPEQPTAALQVIDGGLAPLVTLHGLKWWAKLSQPEQQTVDQNTVDLAEDLRAEHESQIASGQRLAALQGVLEPHNVFTRYLTHFHLNKRTAYRRIAKYRNAAQLPGPILELAMARNIPIGGDTEQKPFGQYTESVRKLPPPRNPSPEQAAAWLSAIEQNAKETRQANADAAPGTFAMPEPTDPQTAAKEAFRFVINRFKQLPNNTRIRANWIKSLFGMILTEVGLQGAQQFAPVAVPPDFAAGRGRPRAAQTVAQA